MGQFSMEKPALKGQFSVEINTEDVGCVIVAGFAMSRAQRINER